MKIQIKSTGFELTPALNKFIEDKLGVLGKYLVTWEKNREILLRVEVAKGAKHHKKGNVFYAEANLDLPQETIRIEEYHEDMHAAIDGMRDRLKNDLLKLKAKISEHKGSEE